MLPAVTFQRELKWQEPHWKQLWKSSASLRCFGGPCLIRLEPLKRPIRLVSSLLARKTPKTKSRQAAGL